jgi:hypothetical protein
LYQYEKRAAQNNCVSFPSKFHFHSSSILFVIFQVLNNIIRGGGGAGDKRCTDSIASPGVPASKKIQTVQLLDPKYSNNCKIMLRRLKMEPAAIKAAIMSLNEKETKSV